jgi:hypothetical protein
LTWLSSFYQSFGGVEPSWAHDVFTSTSTEPKLISPLGDAHFNPDGSHLDHVVIDAPLVPDLYEEPGPENRQRVYQSFMVVNDFARRWQYPGAALWDDIDNLPVNVCVSLIGRSITNRKARQELNKLFRQVAFTEDESAEDVTPNMDALLARDDLIDELGELTNHNGPATPVTVVFRFGEGSAEELRDAKRLVRDALDSTQTHFSQALGMQSRIWDALVPGSTKMSYLRKFERRMHAKGVAGLGLFHGHELGDPDGRVYAFLATSAGAEDSSPQLVLRNPMRGPTTEGQEGAAAIASLGAPRKGKSMAVKMDGRQVAQMGGGVLAIDWSREREWVKAMEAFPCDATVIDPSDPSYTFDPLRTFTANMPSDAKLRKDLLRMAERHTLGFFCIQLSIPEIDDLRHDVLKTAILDLLSDDPPLPPSSPNMLALLHQRAQEDDNPASRDATLTLVRRLGDLARSGAKGASIMGNGRPLDLRSQAVVISDPGLDLSTLEGQATMYLCTAYTIAFMSATSRFNLNCLTEVYALTKEGIGHWGQRLMDDVLTQAARANSGMSADSQLARHFRHPELFTERTVACTNDPGAAQAALEFCGAEATPAVVARVQNLPVGMKFYRDRYGRMGFVDVLAPFEAEVFEALRTTPIIESGQEAMA